MKLMDIIGMYGLCKKHLYFEILFITKITELLTVEEEVVVALMTSEIEFET